MITRNLSRLPREAILSTKKQLPRDAISRGNATSTMALSANLPRVEQTATLCHSDHMMQRNQELLHSLSSCYDKVQYSLHFPSNPTVSTSSDVEITGLEVSLLEAAALAKSEYKFVDKIVLFISHGETKEMEEEEESSKINLSLSGKGIGQALSTSREAGIFCNNNTGLVPQLFVVSPLRCTAESALLAFPHSAPGSIHDTPWVCHDKCVDEDIDIDLLGDDINILEREFPGVNYDLVNGNSSESFASWLKKRKEKVIVVSSTKSWIDEFINSYAPTKTFEENDKVHHHIKSIGIKFN